MQDSRIDISMTKVVTMTLWAWMAFVLTLAWVAWFIWGPGIESLWMMLGFTACASSAVAATAQIRCYSVALSAVVKGRQALDRQQASVHSLR